VVESEWRAPDGFFEPLTGGPFSKLRVGQYRRACPLDRSESVLEVRRIEHRSGAYTAADDRRESIHDRRTAGLLNGIFEAVYRIPGEPLRSRPLRG
jgi:hypothetical protein